LVYRGGAGKDSGQRIADRFLLPAFAGTSFAGMAKRFFATLRMTRGE